MAHKSVPLLKVEIKRIGVSSQDTKFSCPQRSPSAEVENMETARRTLKDRDKKVPLEGCVRGHVPDAIKKNMELWVGCVAGA
jgi:hypothetical protein